MDNRLPIVQNSFIQTVLTYSAVWLLDFAFCTRISCKNERLATVLVVAYPFKKLFKCQRNRLTE